MRMSAQYCCNEAGCNFVHLFEKADGLHCPNGHFFPYVQGSEIPLFACEDEDSNDYALKDAAVIHDNALKWVFDTFGADEASLRKNLISRLHLSKGQIILITGAGAGNDLPYFMEMMDGAGIIYAQDISKQMLMAGFERHGATPEGSGIEIFFSISDATDLPFDKNFFDAAYHFGGLNLFPDIQKGMSEMNRVVKPGGRIVISDEGAAPWLKPTELGKMLIRNNPLYAFDAPMALLPENARSVNLSWELSGCFYVIEFTVSDDPLHINIDVPHIGKRGGSIRSRYLGQLEGVDPALRDQIYADAEKLGLSRVAYLERLLRSGRA